MQFNDGDGVSRLEASGLFLHQFSPFPFHLFISVSSHSHHFSFQRFKRFQRFQRFLTQLTLLRLCQCQVGHHASFGGSEALLRVVTDYICHCCVGAQTSEMRISCWDIVGPIISPCFVSMFEGKNSRRSSKSLEEYKLCQVQCATEHHGAFLSADRKSRPKSLQTARCGEAATGHQCISVNSLMQPQQSIAIPFLRSY